MERMFISQWTAAVAVTVAFALGIAAGYYVLAEHVHKSACESWGGTYVNPNPDVESPKVCWPVVQR